MTTKETIAILQCPDAYGGIYGQAYRQAVHMAIMVLEATKKMQTDILDSIQGFTMGGKAYVLVSDVAESITKLMTEVDV